MIQMFDTVTVDTVPPNPPAVAGYVGGSWPTYNALVAKFPDAHHLSIAVNSGEDAECLDIENGDARPDQAPGWVRRQQARGVAKPCLYANASTMPTVLDALRSAGFHRSDVRLWVADWTYSPHVPAGFDACQWTDRALGRNLDESLCLDSFFGPPPPPPDPHHYAWFPATLVASPWGEISEHKVVVQYDGARQHPLRYARYLRKLRDQLSVLAGRVLTVAHEHPLPDGHPNWTANNRGWRYQQLIHRAQGQRLA